MGAVAALDVEVAEEGGFVRAGAVGDFEVHVGGDLGDPRDDVAVGEAAVDEELGVDAVGCNGWKLYGQGAVTRDSIIA